MRLSQRKARVQGRKSHMITQVREEDVFFGVVVQKGHDWVFVQPEGQKGVVRLYWSRLRSVDATLGGVVFQTGGSGGTPPVVHRGDEVAFVRREDDLWLWALRSEYETVVSLIRGVEQTLAGW